MKNFFCIVFLVLSGYVSAQVPVVVRGETLFLAADSSCVSSAEHFVDSLIKSKNIDPTKVFKESSDSLYGIGYGDSTFVWLFCKEGEDVDSVLDEACLKFQDFLKNPPEEKAPLGLSSLFRLLLALASPVVFVILVLILARIARRMIRYFLYQEGRMIKGVKFGKFSLLPAREELLLFINIIRWTRNIIVLILFYGMMLFIFYLYPATRSFANHTFSLTIQALRDVGITILNIIGFSLGAIILYAVARIFMKITDIVFRHYEQSERKKIPPQAIQPLKTISKIIIALIFILVFVAVLPDPGGTIAIVGLFTVIVVIGLAVLPVLQQYIIGYSIIFKNIIKTGDKILFKNEEWIVEEISPLFVHLMSANDNVKKITISPQDLVSGGIVCYENVSSNEILREDDRED